MDAYTIDLSPLKYVKANITTLRLVDPSKVDVINTVYEYRTKNRFDLPKKADEIQVNHKNQISNLFYFIFFL